MAHDALTRLQLAMQRTARLEAQILRAQERLQENGNSDKPIPDQLAFLSLSVAKLSRENEGLRLQLEATHRTMQERTWDQTQRSFFEARTAELRNERATLVQCNANQSSENRELQRTHREMCERVASCLSCQEFTEREICQAVNQHPESTGLPDFFLAAGPDLRSGPELVADVAKWASEESLDNLVYLCHSVAGLHSEMKSKVIQAAAAVMRGRMRNCWIRWRLSGCTTAGTVVKLRKSLQQYTEQQQKTSLQVWRQETLLAGVDRGCFGLVLHKARRRALLEGFRACETSTALNIDAQQARQLAAAHFRYMAAHQAYSRWATTSNQIWLDRSRGTRAEGFWYHSNLSSSFSAWLLHSKAHVCLLCSLGVSVAAFNTKQQRKLLCWWSQCSHARSRESKALVCAADVRCLHSLAHWQHCSSVWAAQQGLWQDAVELWHFRWLKRHFLQWKLQAKPESTCDMWALVGTALAGNATISKNQTEFEQASLGAL
eukprot:TRINITY_DN10926_c0_g2_i1.p1 TRINITY_DN10926_c0_g2~~TRINITY_DN10926_c0_g2_i1.p1  ORF type:complete len:490 (+),score=81.09 TRINITY_DN10926_c0_g2_i1:190-1659(+)